MPSSRETRLVTIATVRQPNEKSAIEVLFNEYQRIFAIDAKGRARTTAATELRSAMKSDAPIKATLDTKSGLILRVAEPSKKELDEYRRTRILLESPEKGYRIDVATIDPTRFNVIDVGLKIPIFRRCTKVVPSYAKAKQIFDYCAAQACVPGPAPVPPCIPFQYVRDGCHARAHQMRKLINGKFRVCVEKVFSVANSGGDTLRIRADKVGGCCVAWWFHVAPLLRVKVKIRNCTFTLAMVIDPSMFDKPVLLSTWLAAQENATCGSNAHVSMYTIQPWTAYTPANFAATAFTTDPNYTATNATLANYSTLTTCP